MQHGLLDAASHQRMLCQALDGSDELVLILQQARGGTDGPMIIACNDAFCRLSGHGPEAIVGTQFSALAAAGSDAAAWQAALASVRDRRSLRSDLLCARPGGGSFHLGLHLMPVPNSEQLCSVLLGRDITAGFRDQQQHAAIQGLLAKVFVSVQAPVAIVDERGTIMMTNPALDNLLGYPVGGAVGKPAVNFVAPSSRPAAVTARERQIATGENYTIEIRVLHADGSEFPVKLASILVEREDLKRFRILTLNPVAAPVAAPPVTVHVAGKIKLIGLEDIKASLGARWAATAAKAMGTAEHIVKRYCGPRDIWSRTTDSGFVISFHETSEEEAALRAAAIARDIRARLIGEGEAPSASYVSAITASVELPDQPGRTPDMLAALLAQRLAARLTEIEARARETLQQSMQFATCELGAIRNRRTLEIVGHFATLPHGVDQRLQCALAVLPGSEREAFDFDRLVLGTAAEKIVDMLASGSTMPLFVAVDFDMFHDRHCTERYVAACRALDNRLRQLLVLVLTNVPRSVPRNRLLECVMRLRPFCHSVVFQTAAVEMPPLEASLLSGSIVVLRGTNTSRWGTDDLAKLDKLVAAARAHRARLLVQHHGNWDNARRLLKLDVDLIALPNDNASRDAAIRDLARAQEFVAR